MFERGEKYEVNPDESTARAYGGLPVYERAKAAGRTKLTYEQWVAVRTPGFKQRFGDWEALRAQRALSAMEPANLDGVAPVAGKKAIEDVFRSLGTATNKADSRKIIFPVSMAGKIVGHRGFDVGRIVNAFGQLFSGAVPMFSETEILRAGHKAHPEIAGYHHYVGKFEQGGTRYYIRFTVHEMRVRKGNEGKSIAHSSFVSDVALYRQGVPPDSAGGRVTYPVLTGGSTPLDRRLAQWFVEGNPSTVSKDIDPDTGEPLAGALV